VIVVKTNEINNELVPTLLNADNVLDLWSNFTYIMSKFNFDRLIYGTTKFSQTGSTRALRNGLLLSNHKPEYIKEMIRNRCFDNDTRWIRANNKNNIGWNINEQHLHKSENNFSEILFYPSINIPPSEYERNMWKLYKDYNVKAGYTLFFKHKIGTGTSGLALCSSPKMNQNETNEYWKKHGKSIEYLTKLFDELVRNLPYSNPSLLLPNKKLTKRQQQVLNWISKGKSIQEISIIMHLSIPTIDKHLRLARENLNAKTTIQAMIRAQETQQLYNFNYFDETKLKV